MIKIIKKKNVFLFYTKRQIQYIARRTVGHGLSAPELQCLKAKTINEIHNLIIKINSTGVK